MPRQKVIPAVVKEEEIHALTHVPGSHVAVAIGVGVSTPEGFEFDADQIFETVHIVGQDYQDLMAQDGAGLIPGKPAGVFRREDLWPFIDRVRARKDGAGSRK